MKLRRHDALRRVTALFVVAVALVPLALSGHFHTKAEGSTPDACAACVVKHHTRTASLSLPPAPVPVLRSCVVAESIAAAPAHVALPFQTGRAPPAPFAGHIA